MSVAITQGVSLWAIVLAGGDGTRLRSLVDQIYADGRPKQFASLIGSRSLLRTTLDRVGRFVPADRTIILTVERYRALATAELGSSGYWTLEQPLNRGTAAAILWAALWVERRDPDAAVVVVPSDHHIGDDREFADHLLALTSLTRSDPNRVFLLGARPSRPETSFGWIEPGEVIWAAGSRPIREVRRFREKPTEDAWLSAGYFVFEPGVFEYLWPADDCILERDPLELRRIVDL